MSVVVTAGLLAGFGRVYAAPREDFPLSLETSVLTAWVKEHTDLPPDRVALAGPVHVVAVVPAKTSATGLRRAVVEGEVIDRAWAEQHRLVSWRTEVEVDCKSGRVKSPTGKSYGRRKRSGPATAIFASADWTIPPSNDPIFEVVQAICRADYRWPLRSPPVQMTARAPQPAPVVAAQPNAGDAPMRTGARLTMADPPASPPPPVVAVPSSESIRPPPAPAPSAPVRPPPASSGKGPYAVQVLASSSKAKAQAELATVSRVLSMETRGLKPLVVPVMADGKQFYRVLFSGLDSATKAQGLCQAASRLGYECLVRKF